MHILLITSAVMIANVEVFLSFCTIMLGTKKGGRPVMIFQEAAQARLRGIPQPFNYGEQEQWEDWGEGHDNSRPHRIQKHA